MKKSLGAQTLVFPTPTWIVGTYDQDERPNVMAAAWGGICCSDPPCIAVSLRKATYTYGSLMGRRAFTVNVPAESQVKEADYFGLVSGRDVDKFATTGFTPVRSDIVDAPYVDQFPMVLECNVIHTFELGLHTQFVGQIMDVKADETVLGAEALPEIDKVRPIIFAPGDRMYYGVGASLGQAFAVGKEI
jgi:flavin reductase (DIM6/NTAB) family NADH-FMN oxidoreductase RutF